MNWLSFSMGVILGATRGIGFIGVCFYGLIDELRIENSKLKVDLLHNSKKLEE